MPAPYRTQKIDAKVPLEDSVQSLGGDRSWAHPNLERGPLTYVRVRKGIVGLPSRGRRLNALARRRKTSACALRRLRSNVLINYERSLSLPVYG